jgi:hypothetical protein
MRLHKRNSRRFFYRGKAASEFCLMRIGHSPSLIASGELHGRKLASAFMRSRVHNRTCDRGGKPTWLARGVGIAPGPSGGAGGVVFRPRLASARFDFCPAARLSFNPCPAWSCTQVRQAPRHNHGALAPRRSRASASEGFDRCDHHQLFRPRPRARPVGRHWRGDALPQRQAGTWAVS